MSSRAWWLLLVPLLAGNCSSHDVKLGEDLPEPTPGPDPDPEPIVDPDPPSPAPDPTPTPTPTEGCEVREPDAFCMAASEHCSGRLLTGAGFECSAGDVCCLQLITAPPPGGASGQEQPLGGVGGQ